MECLTYFKKCIIPEYAISGWKNLTKTIALTSIPFAVLQYLLAVYIFVSPFDFKILAPRFKVSFTMFYPIYTLLLVFNQMYLYRPGNLAKKRTFSSLKKRDVLIIQRYPLTISHYTKT